MDDLRRRVLVIAYEMLQRPAGSADSADIAERVGMTREEAARIVKGLERDGYLDVWPQAAFGPTLTITGLTDSGLSALRESA